MFEHSKQGERTGSNETLLCCNLTIVVSLAWGKNTAAL
jgi:hypothetical protein